MFEFDLLWILGILFAYLIGNLSPATMLSSAKGVDIRKEGSGNPGTTNVLRTLGKKSAALTLLIDALKGVLAVLAGRLLGGETLAMVCAIAVLAGHIWPVFYKFKGGKGIATGLGVLLAFDWRIGLLSLGIAALGMLLSRRVSVGSLTTAAALPVVSWWIHPEFLPYALLITVIVFWKHRKNIQRLIQGTEPKVNLKK